MALTRKGKKIMAAMVKHYKSAAKAKEVFYAMVKDKKLVGVEKK